MIKVVSSGKRSKPFKCCIVVLVLVLVTILLLAFRGGQVPYIVATPPIPSQTELRNWNAESVPPEQVTQIDYNLTKDDIQQLKEIVECNDKNVEQRRYQRSDFWVLENYIPAEVVLDGCASSVTYTTHGDYSFLDNVIPLLERWQAPLSMAIYAPGYDYDAAIHSIIYLRNCVPKRSLVKKFATFHIYFHRDHLPKKIISFADILSYEVNCSTPAPFMNAKSENMYKATNNLTYPVNVGRNLARDASLTYYVLASDVELYPSLNVVPNFLKMIVRNKQLAYISQPKVFVFPIFEIKANIIVPRNKTILQKYANHKLAIRFHQNICASCHEVPKAFEWMQAPETSDLDIFATSKRVGRFQSWEPIFIGTINDPYYEERLSWEGKADKMTQGYALCVMDYDFHVLNNAFLVHRPGIKTLKSAVRAGPENENKRLIASVILPEMKIIFGTRDQCHAI